MDNIDEWKREKVRMFLTIYLNGSWFMKKESEVQIENNFVAIYVRYVLRSYAPTLSSLIYRKVHMHKSIHTHKHTEQCR